MICLFDKFSSREEVLTTNGDYILDNICTKMVIKESLNGDFIAEGTFILNNEFPKELYDMINELSILRITDESSEEVFRIISVRKYKKYIDVVCRHITITDTVNLWLENVKPTELTGSSAIDYIYKNSIGKKDLFVSSDIQEINTAYYENVKVHQAFTDSENSFLNKWGGEITRNGYNLSINKRRGTDTDVIIESRKDLTGFESRTNLDSLCTGIVPKGYGYLKAPIQYSPLVDNYPSPIIKEFKYEFVKVKDENNPDEGFETEQEGIDELIRLAKREFSENHIDVIQAEYTINYIDLSRTKEYKDFISTQTLELGDSITVHEKDFDIKVNSRIISRTYDVLKKSRISTELSNVKVIPNPPTVSNLIAELEKITSKGDNLSDYITAILESGIKDSYVVLKPNELLIMDSKDINTAKNVTRYNKNGLGFSTTGYYGNYTYGFTIDGKINASLIATGILSTVLIQNSDGSLQIDLGNTNGINFKKNNHVAFNLNGNEMKFFDWQGTERTTPVGTLSSSRIIRSGTQTSIPGVMLANEKNSYMTLGYRNDSGNYSSYIDFDISNVIPKAASVNRLEDDTISREITTYKPIAVQEGVDFKDYSTFSARPSMKYGIWLGKDDDSYITNNYNRNCVELSSPNGISVSNDDYYLFTANTERTTSVSSSGYNYFNVTADGRFSICDKLYTNNLGNVVCNASLLVTGDIQANARSSNLSERLTEKPINLLHELYVKDLEIEQLKSDMEELKKEIANIKEMIGGIQDV